MTNFIDQEELGMNGDGLETLVTAPKYYWGCCMVCRRTATKSSALKRCAGCSCLFYCSKEHQKLDWRQHKRLCSYLSTAAEEIGADNFFAREQRLDLENEFSGEPYEQKSESNRKTQIENDLDEETTEDPALVEKETTHIDSLENSHKLMEWTKFRMNAVRTCQILMGRPLEEWEKEIFLFPRACRVCHTSRNKPNMIDCISCLGVTYCSKDCQELDENHHAKFCQELKYAMVCDNYESTVSVAAPPIPSDLDGTYYDTSLLKLNMKKHLELLNRQDQYEFEDDEDIEGEQQVDLREMEKRFLSDRLTGPLTLLYVAQLCKLANGASIGQKKELVIHIAGSNTVEMLGIIKWEYLAHRLPQLESMRLVFIGPELAEHEEEDSLISAMASSDGNPLGICGNCADQGRAIHYEVRRRLYHEYAHSADYSVPDIVCAFNCGFHEFSAEHDKDKETWAESLPYLIRNIDVPLVFTSYTRTEASKDLIAFTQAIKQHENQNLGSNKLIARADQVKVEVEMQLNPFRSNRSIRDFEFDNNCDTFYSNQFMTVVRKIS